MKYVVRIVAVLVPIVVAAAPVHATPTLSVDSQSVSVDLGTSSATFHIQFNRAPDFFSVDGMGHQTDAFQYFISDGVTSDPFAPYDNTSVVIRGSEIHSNGGLIPIRAYSPPSADPAAEGFGAILESDSFTLNGADLTFKTSLSALGALDGKFQYSLEAYQDGVLTYVSPVVPEPSTSVLGLIGIALGAAAYRFRRKA
jgi:hypothetical protein